ncbi:MAG: phosphoadenylyl-sulfate reductase [Pseudomonadota bacterium]
MVGAPTAISDADIKFAAELSEKYEKLQPAEIIAQALETRLFRKPAVVSSFGAEAVVLLHMVASIRPSMPVVFIDTGKLFGETLRYRDRLQHHLGLEDVRTVGPKKAEIEEHDPMGSLNRLSPDACCAVRKTAVLNRALQPFDSWLSGRKRHQSDLRRQMSIVEIAEGRAKLNPLSNWSQEELKHYIITNRLPMHPLTKDGYFSIGCLPCSERAMPNEDPRSGRWKGFQKTECGIHLPPDRNKD